MAHIIPTIDISSFISDPSSPAAAEVVSEVQKACTTFGFFQITGHGIPYHLQREALDGAKAFFALPLEEKRKLDRATVPGANARGYEVLKSQVQLSHTGKAADSKEGYYVGFDISPNDPCIKEHPRIQGPNLWPPSSILPYSTFKEPLQRYHTALVALIRKMFLIVHAGLPNVDFAIFEDFMANYPIALLSPKHYPPSDTEHGAIGSGEHTDWGALTLLLQDGNPGLEIYYDNAWVPVAPTRDAYVVNIGDMMYKWTSGKYKSTLHRVVAPKGNVHRYSMPFFFNGNPAFRIIPFEGSQDGGQVQTVEEHLLERLGKTMVKA
ncbi:citrinin biosynthesis oxygenase CtnA [Phlyctema vagabunda]|uniref:Citrinin biosynthesis oxygenase CtnA n=1 Tax=Phlyctema vagabunda TaxID=108571 RepID=A0ABR4PE64_9HELO